MEYPALVVYYSFQIMAWKALTQSWRFKWRLKMRSEYTLEQMLQNVSEKDKQSVYKDYCLLELLKTVPKLKNLRNQRRNTLALVALRLDLPKDIIDYTLSFTRYNPNRFIPPGLEKF